MVTHSGATLRTDQLRALNQPRPIAVEAQDDRPRALAAGRARRRARVAQVQDVWRIDDEWWRAPISRRYFRLVLDDGSQRIVYHDLVAGRWFEQGY